MSNSPEVSVIITNFNHANFLGQAIESVLQQSLQNLELLVVDNGSTDNSQEIIEAFDDSRITKVYLEENIGQAEALNHALTLTEKSKFVAFLAADDYWSRNKLEEQIRVFDEYPDVGIVFTLAKLFGDPEIIQRKHNQNIQMKFLEPLNHSQFSMQKFLTDRNSFAFSSALLRVEVIDKVGGFDSSLTQLIDFDYWVRAIRFTSIHKTGQQSTFVRIHGNSLNISGESIENLALSEIEWRAICCRELLRDEALLSSFLDAQPMDEGLAELTYLAAMCIQDSHQKRPNRAAMRLLASEAATHFSKIHSLLADLENTEKELRAIENSITWKLSKPVRRFVGFLNELFQGNR